MTMEINHAKAVANSLGITVESGSANAIVGIVQNAYRRGADESGGSLHSRNALHNCQTQLGYAVNHVKALLKKSGTFAERRQAEIEAINWLKSIGGES